MQAVLAIAQQFAPDAKLRTAAPLGNGLINDTFLVSSTTAQWVIQRINRQVFPKPHWVMENLHCLLQHVQKKPAQQVKLCIPAIITTPQQQSYFVDEHGDYWRALQFIPQSYSKEQLVGITDAEQVGWALGHFHTLSSDLSADLLHDTLPGFHCAPEYLLAYQQLLSERNNKAPDAQAEFCQAYIARHAALTTVLEAAKASNELTLRVMHGDPKVNNFLFDQHTHHIISLIDLDTVKPGLLHYDLGDCLRSSCHNTADDSFDLGLAEAVLKHYLAQVRDFFTAADYHYIYAAIALIPFELGIRFFSDYLQGNCYFKVSDPQQNCRRAVQQFKLCDSIQKQRGALEALIKRLQTLH